MRTYKRKNAVEECTEPIEGVLELCRLCLEEAKDSVPIFANKNDMCTALATRIMMCVGYEITREDCLPNAICTECHNKLNKYYEFRKKCDNSYHKLKNHLHAVQARTAKKLSIKQEHEEQEASLFENTPVCPVSELDCPISQSDSPISQSVCPINQSVFTQSVSAVTQSVSAVNQSVCAVSQPVCAVSQTVDQIDSIGSQSICMASQTDFTVSKSGCRVVKAGHPVEQAGYPVSHLVNMSREQLILAFEKPLEIVQTELQQTGLDHTVNGWMDEAVNNKSVADIPEPMEVCPDVTEFLSSILIDMGILKRQRNELQMTEECKTIQIETGNGEQITLELVTIEEEQTKTTSNKSRKAKGKATNEVTKQIKDERPQCTECGRSFASRAVLKRHARTHTGERPFRCASCGLSFTQREVLTRHELVHQVPQCTECGRSFASRAVLKRHARTHTGERPFRCASCGLSFTQREVLTRHKLVHQEVRPFPCERCPKSFTQRGALAAHAHNHAPSAPRPVHQCAVCPKRFLHASGLSRHSKWHSGRVYACAACGRRCSDDSALRRHARLKHPPRHPPQEI